MAAPFRIWDWNVNSVSFKVVTSTLYRKIYTASPPWSLSGGNGTALLLICSCCSCWWRETTSTNCGYQRAYCSSHRWYMSVDSHGVMMLTGETDDLGENLSQSHFYFYFTWKAWYEITHPDVIVRIEMLIIITIIIIIIIIINLFRATRSK
jgi:hypothetical protein